jgi:hypothetical protein
VHPDLERCLAILDDCTRGIAPDAARARIDGRWSVAEIVEHLDRTYSGTAKGFEKCLEAGAPLAKNFSLKGKLRAFVVVTLGRFPEGVPAPKHVIPTSEVDLPTALANARRDLERFDRAAIAARDRFGSGPVLDHPLIGAFTVDQWLRFHVVHTRHHEKQIRARAVGRVR